MIQVVLMPGSRNLTTKKLLTPIHHETIAAVAPYLQKQGSSPNSMGMEIGPTRPPNQMINSSSTPPKWLALMAISKVVRMNSSTVTRATSNDARPVANLRGNSLGRISRVTTAVMALESEEVMDNVWVNMATSTRPTSPCGSRFIAISE